MLAQSKPREIGIPFIFELRKAILNTKPDRTPIDPNLPIKYQTRRLLNPQPKGSEMVWNQPTIELMIAKCPYQVGDYLYIKEPTTVKQFLSDNCAVVEYEDGQEFEVKISDGDRIKIENRKNPFGKLNGRFMLKSFARHWVEVEEVKLQFLQEISEPDAIAEGVSRDRDGWKCYGNCPEHKTGHDQRTTATASFLSLWDSIHRDYPWSSNPIVYAITFKHR
ncbi:MAG TPA: hypothetical protein V6C65_04150 [Allocoleopsis sp.]